MFIDEDGTPYLFWARGTKGRNEIWASRLSAGLDALEGEPALCFAPTQEWETRAWHGHVVNEAPAVIKHNGTYYLLYTGNHFLDTHYGVGYATASKPLGPWVKFEGNPTLSRTEAVAGPGSGMPIPSPDGKEWVFVYHTHKSPEQAGPRKVSVDRLRFVPQPNGIDRIEIAGPTTTEQATP